MISYIIDDSISDNDLANLAKTGNKNAIAQLYIRYRPNIRAIGFKVLRKEEDVEDFEVDMVLRLYEKVHLYKRGNFGAWYKSMIRNSARNFHRYERLREGEEFDETFTLGENIEDLVHRNKVSELVADAMGKLSENYRRVLVLRYWEDLSYREIADRLDSDIINVTSWLHRAKKSLRGYLDEQMVLELGYA